MKIYNRTQFELNDIDNMTPIKVGRNMWRKRDIKLYDHPTDQTMVISDGITFDQSTRVIAEESKDFWERQLFAGGNFVTL